MQQNWMLRMTVGIGILIFVLTGCGQKKTETNTAIQQQLPSMDSVKLPELEQNKINRGKTQPEPDYSFQPFPDDQEAPLPEAAAENPSPHID